MAVKHKLPVVVINFLVTYSIGFVANHEITLHHQHIILSGASLPSNEIPSDSIITAGENDKLPKDGLVLANKLRVIPSTNDVSSSNDLLPIYLLSRATGWGTGVHPTTRLCIEWLANTIQGNEIVLDYGCGSGILSIASLRLGAGRVIGVDVEYEALTTAEENLELNDYSDFFESMHVREITPFGIEPPVDICIANILIGQLVRPSMVAAIVTNMKPNALLCLSGIRPHQVSALKEAYNEYMDWIDEDENVCTLTAKDTEGSIDSYGFDVGT